MVNKILKPIVLSLLINMERKNLNANFTSFLLILTFQAKKKLLLQRLSHRTQTVNKIGQKYKQYIWLLFLSVFT